MIILDTHTWIWWVQSDVQLTVKDAAIIQANESDGLGISAFSLWEVALAVKLNRLSLPLPVEDWLTQALAYPGIQLLHLTPRIVVESTRLPGNFHKDPADQIIVATARIFDCPLMTYDGKILKYPHVKLLP